MEFAELLNSLQRFTEPLPGPTAHARMVNYARPILKPEQEINDGTRLSGVMVLLFPEGSKSHLVLIKRPDYNGVHGGQISFPGGKKEPSDENLLHTALRETLEEVGVDGGLIKVVGELSPVFIPPSNFFVRPYIGLLHEKPVFRPDKREVAEVLTMPVGLLSDPRSVAEKSVYIAMLNREMQVKCYQWDGHIIWGATAMMLAELAEILFGPQ